MSGFVDPVEVRQIENDLKGEVTRLLRDFVSRAVVDAPTTESDELKPKKKGRPRKNAKK